MMKNLDVILLEESVFIASIILLDMVFTISNKIHQNEMKVVNLSW